MTENSPAGHGFGIVGAGVIAAVHAEAIGMVPGARLVAVTDVVPESAKELAGRYGCAADPDLDALLARPDVDVVSICVPSGLHAEVGTQAVAAGKHLVIEKPIDVTLEAADRLIARRPRRRGCHDGDLSAPVRHRAGRAAPPARRAGPSAPCCSATRARSGTGPRATTTARRGAAPGPWTAGH